IKMQSRIDSDSEPEKEVMDSTIMSRKSLYKSGVPQLEIPFAVQNVISRIEQAQLHRAREAINMQLADIMLNVQRIINRYTLDENVHSRRKISITEYKKRRVNFMEKIVTCAKNVEITEKTLVYILAWLEEWNAILSEMTAIDIEEHHHWIAQMELLPEMFKAIENNVKLLCRISVFLFEEKKRQRKKTTSRSTLWKSWKERVIKRPATAHALRPDQMISDEFATNTKVSEIQDMLQELINTMMFNKLENNAIKYISSTIINLSKALGIINDELKIFKLQSANMYISETSEKEKELSLKIMRELSEKNEMLQQKLQEAEEKYEQFIRSKIVVEPQVGTALPTSTLKVLPELSSQSSTSKADIEDNMDDILVKELEDITDEAQTKGTKGLGIKWDSTISHRAPAEMTPDLTEEQYPSLKKKQRGFSEGITEDKISQKKGDVYRKDGTDQYQSQEKKRTKGPYMHETSGFNVSDDKGKEKDSETKLDYHLELQSLEKKRKEIKSFSEDKSKSFTESRKSRSDHVPADYPSTDTKSQIGRNGTSGLWEQFKKLKPEYSHYKSQISSESKEESITESMDKESKSETSSQAEQFGFTQLGYSSEKVKTKGKKHHVSPGTTTSKEGKLEEDILVTKKVKSHRPVKPKSRVTEETSESTRVLRSLDGRSEESNLEEFQKAVMAFLKEKIDNVGKPLDKKTVPKEELLKTPEAEKLGIIKEKIEEYFQNVGETVTKTLRKYKDIKSAGQAGEKSLKQKKVSFMPGLHFQKPTSAKSEISTLLSSKSKDPLTDNLIQTILAELEGKRDALVPSTVGRDGKERQKQRREEHLQEGPEKIVGKRLKHQLQEGSFWNKLQEEEPWLQRKGGKQGQRKQKQWQKMWKEQQKQRMQKQTEQDEEQTQREEEDYQKPKQQQLEAWDKKMEKQVVPLEKEKGQQKRDAQKEVRYQELEINWEKEEKQEPWRNVEDHERQRQKETKDQMKIKINSEAQAQGITLTPPQAQALGITLTPEQAQAQGITLTPQQAQALGMTLTPEQVQAQGITLTPPQAHPLGITLTPPQAQALGITLTPPQAQALGITLTPEQAQAQGITLTPQQAQALGMTLNPQQAQVLGITLTPEQAQAQGITLTPQQAQALGIPLTLQQAQAQGITLTPQLAEALGMALTPEQAQALGMTHDFLQAQGLGATLIPEQAQAQGMTLTPPQAQAPGITLTPEQAQALGITLTPQQAQALGIPLTPQQAQAEGMTFTPQQAQALGITLTPQQAQTLGMTLTPEQAQAQEITLTLQQALALGITFTPEQAQEEEITLTLQQAQALGITLTPEQAQAQAITLTPEQAQALGLTLIPQQIQANGITLTPDHFKALAVTLTPEKCQSLGFTLTPGKLQGWGSPFTVAQSWESGVSITPESPWLSAVPCTPEQTQGLGAPLSLEQAQALGVSFSPEHFRKSGVPLTSDKFRAIESPLEQVQTLGAPFIPGQSQPMGITLMSEEDQQSREQPSPLGPQPPLEHTLKVGIIPVTDKPITPGGPHISKQFPTLAPSGLRSFQRLKASVLPGKSFTSSPRQAPASAPIAEKSSVFEVSPTPLQVSGSPLSQAPGKLLGMRIPSDLEKLLVPQTFPSSKQTLVSEGQTIQFVAPEDPLASGKLAPETLLSSRKFLRDSWTPQLPLISEAPLAPRQPLISGVPLSSPQFSTLLAPLSPRKPLVPGTSSILKPRPLTLSEKPQAFQLPAIYEQSLYPQVPSTLEQHQTFPLGIPPTPGHPPTLWTSLTPGKPQKDMSSSIAKESKERLAIISSLKSKSVPFTAKNFQISGISDTSKEFQTCHDPIATEQYRTFQSYLTDYRTPVSHTPYVGGRALPPLVKSLFTQLPKTSQISSSEWDQKTQFPPIDKSWILTSDSVTKKPKMMVPPSSPQELKEQRYFVDVEAQRKNLVLLNQATKSSGLPSQLHTTARNLIIETLHTDTVRLGYLFRKYIAYRLIQRARNNIIRRLQALRNTGKGYETQNLFIMLNRIDDYQKKMMQVWTNKQKSLEQKRNQCLRKMMFLFSQLQEMYKLNLSWPIPLITDKKEIPASAKFVQQPFLELLIKEDRKSDTFKKLRQEEQMRAIWNADLSTSSYPIAEKTSIHSLWAQLGGYPDIPMLLQLDVQSTFRKSLASIKSQKHSPSEVKRLDESQAVQSGLICSSFHYTTRPPPNNPLCTKLTPKAPGTWLGTDLQLNLGQTAQSLLSQTAETLGQS
ncbi:protein FAM186A, partial [Enhydra lutris kenyoni]|uniref:Protein FAM186A n=1 Tax=Enhydra lutris kenyoni TaxID=391180 RepID=A0A2Y9KMD2_ENHLU